jgi:hypothetical protein
MISYRRRRDSPQRLLDSRGHLRVMRIFLFGQRSRRRLVEVIDGVPREGPNHSRVAVSKRET